MCIRDRLEKEILKRTKDVEGCEVVVSTSNMDMEEPPAMAPIDVYKRQIYSWVSMPARAFLYRRFTSASALTKRSTSCLRSPIDR